MASEGKSSGGGCCGWSRKHKEKEDGPVTKKPNYNKITQQELSACKPVLTTTVVTLIFLLVTIVFVPVGIVCLVYGLRAKDLSYRYDLECLASQPNNTARQAYLWENAGNNAALSCTINIPIDKDMNGPIYVYYEIRGMYQNHRRYVRSHMDLQLADQSGWRTNVDVETSAQSCVPLIYYAGNNSELINPCGLVAWSYFNDTYDIAVTPRGNSSASIPLGLTSDGVAFSSDVKHRFANYTPQFFNPLLNQYRGGNNISGTLKQDQRFMVWMRLSHFPNFRKLWGIMPDASLKKGDVVTVTIINQYNTYPFNGEKRIAFVTTTWLGGRSAFLGAAYIAVGGMSFVFAVIYQIIVFVKPRKFADTARLRQKLVTAPVS